MLGAREKSRVDMKTRLLAEGESGERLTVSARTSWQIYHMKIMIKGGRGRASSNWT